jgi:hypothetical protein
VLVVLYREVEKAFEVYQHDPALRDNWRLVIEIAVCVARHFGLLLLPLLVELGLLAS